MRLVRAQAGFTLAEVLVTMMIMLVVLFALYSIFDMSLKVFRFGNDKVEAVENARLGMEKMEREIRASYPVNGPSSTGTNRYRFFNANGSTSSPPTIAWPNSTMKTQITFGNELNNSLQSNGNQQIDCNPGSATPSTSDDTPCEYITYKLTQTANPSTICTAAVTGPCTLRRVNAADSSGAGDPVVEFVKPDGLQFRYFTASGAVIDPASPGSYTQADIARVEIKLQIDKNNRTQTLTTEVDLRNPGSI